MHFALRLSCCVPLFPFAFYLQGAVTHEGSSCEHDILVGSQDRDIEWSLVGINRRSLLGWAGDHRSIEEGLDMVTQADIGGQLLEWANGGCVDLAALCCWGGRGEA